MRPRHPACFISPTGGLLPHLRPYNVLQSRRHSASSLQIRQLPAQLPAPFCVTSRDLGTIYVALGKSRVIRQHPQARPSLRILDLQSVTHHRSPCASLDPKSSNYMVAQKDSLAASGCEIESAGTHYRTPGRCQISAVHPRHPRAGVSHTSAETKTCF